MRIIICYNTFSFSPCVSTKSKSHIVITMTRTDTYGKCMYLNYHQFFDRFTRVRPRIQLRLKYRFVIRWFFSGRSFCTSEHFLLLLISGKTSFRHLKFAKYLTGFIAYVQPLVLLTYQLNEIPKRWRCPFYHGCSQVDFYIFVQTIAQSLIIVSRGNSYFYKCYLVNCIHHAMYCLFELILLLPSLRLQSVRL